MHRSTKAARVRRAEVDVDVLRLNSIRGAPEVRMDAKAWKRRKSTRERLLHQHGTMSAREAPVVRLSADLNPILSARFPHLVR